MRAVVTYRTEEGTFSLVMFFTRQGLGADYLIDDVIGWTVALPAATPPPGGSGVGGS